MPLLKKVSKLVVLQEEAENGNEMPDLSMPVRIVKMAADNLIKVNKTTKLTSIFIYFDLVLFHFFFFRLLMKQLTRVTIYYLNKKCRLH